MAALHTVKKARQCHDRLAGADVALQEAVHRVRSGEISGHLPDRPVLGSGQPERQAPEEFVDEARLAEARRDDVRDPGGLGRGGTFLHDEDELEPQQLVEGEAAPGDVFLLEALGGVYPPERLRASSQAELVDHLRWQDLCQSPRAFQRLGDIRGDLGRADLGLSRLRVHGHETARLVADEVHDRVGHLAAAPVDLCAAEDDDLQADRQLADPPRLVEEHDGELPGGVLDDSLHHRLAAAGAASRHASHRCGHHRLVVLGERGDLGLMPAVDVATWVVHQQVQHRFDAHRLEARGFARFDAAQLDHALVPEKPQRAASRRSAHSTETRNG